MMAKIEYQENDGKVFCPLISKWLVAKPEEKVRQRYVCTLVNDYGYSLDQMAQELKVTNSKRGQGKHVRILLFGKAKKIRKIRRLHSLL